MDFLYTVKIHNKKKLNYKQKKKGGLNPPSSYFIDFYILSLLTPNRQCWRYTGSSMQTSPVFLEWPPLTFENANRQTLKRKYNSQSMIIMGMSIYSVFRFEYRHPLKNGILQCSILYTCELHVKRISLHCNRLL